MPYMAGDTAPVREPIAILVLGYEAAMALLGSQEQGLAHLRNRSTGLLAAAAIVTTVASSLGLINTDPSKGQVLPGWASVLLLAVLAAIGSCALAITWPIHRWNTGLRLDVYTKHAGWSESDFYARAIKELDRVIARNDALILRRSYLYRAATLLLIVQVAVLVGILATR